MIELLLQAERAMSVGLLDRAETLYAQVAEADPQNSIAVVGLARVRLERGDEAGALELARRALAIDPENAAASRMVERLEEVLAYRAVEAGTATPAEPEADPRRPRPDGARSPDRATVRTAVARSRAPPQPPTPSAPFRATGAGAGLPAEARSWLDRLSAAEALGLAERGVHRATRRPLPTPQSSAIARG